MLDAPPDTTRHADLGGLMKQALGVIESGIPDLGPNPEHLRGLGATQAIVDAGPLVIFWMCRIGRVPAWPMEPAQGVQSSGGT